MTRLYGIDVSSNQPERVVRDAENQFAIVKMSGNPQSYAWNYVNPYAKQQAKDAMAKHGMLGLYHFTWGKDAHVEAEFFVGQVKKLGYLGKSMLVIDYEAEAVERGRSWVGKLAKRVEELAGYKPVIYASGSVIVSQDLQSLGYPIWCANYPAGYERIDGYRPRGSIYPGCEKSVMWQYTSQGHVDGYGGPLDCNVFFGDAAKFKSYMGKKSTPTPEPKPTPVKTIKRGLLAAAVHADMVNDDSNGYSWSPRWGEDGKGVKTITAYGVKLRYDRGSYDCASSVITAWKAAFEGTKWAHALDGATYTGNIADVFVGSGLFEKKPSTFVAAPGDLYLRHDASGDGHVAMCQSQDPDVMSEFSINEHGGVYGGQVGDQTGREAAINPWRDDFYWVIHYNGKADTKAPTPAPEPTPKPEPTPAPKKPVVYRVSTDPKGKKWLHKYHDHVDTAGGKDAYAGVMGEPIRWLVCNAKKYRVFTADNGWLDWVERYDIHDLESGCAGDGSPIRAVEVADSSVRFAVHIARKIEPKWYPDMVGQHDTGGSSDPFAGDLVNSIDAIRMKRI